MRYPNHKESLPIQVMAGNSWCNYQACDLSELTWLSPGCLNSQEHGFHRSKYEPILFHLRWIKVFICLEHRKKNPLPAIQRIKNGSNGLKEGPESFSLIRLELGERDLILSI